MKDFFQKMREGGKIEQKDLRYKTNKYLSDFQQFETIRYFGDSIYTGKISIDEAEAD